MNLTEFLTENVSILQEVKYAPSARFIGEDGKPVEFTLRPVTSSAADKLQKECMHIADKKRGKMELDAVEWMDKVVSICVIDPNLNDAKLQDAYHVMGAEKVLPAMLTAGEMANLRVKVQEVCGFDTPMADEVETAKN